MRRVATLAIAISFIPAWARAQMTISGQVTTGGQPVQGASVRISELRIESRTGTDGRYYFLLSNAQVRGQTVSMLARHRRYGSQSALVVLDGRALVQDFALAAAEVVVGPTGAADRTSIARSVPPTSRTQDSSVFAGVAGPLDIASALAGRMPGLVITSASAPGASAPMVFRGVRTISGNRQPLIVVDGIPIDNSGFTTAAQQFGLGGFDYGTPAQDLALDDVANVTLLTPAAAAPLYGSRAANGALLVTTKLAGGANGFQFSVNQRFTGETALRLPSYQNKYGQGLGGQFEFFDGMGGGINDDVDQSWGPALEGQPIVQASLTEPRRPDVRPWVPHSTGVRDYFDVGKTYDANVVAQAARETQSLRLAINARNAHGLTPGATATRLGLTVSGAAQPTSRLSVRANAQVVGATGDQRAGTGFDEINPVAGFARMGRQVDLNALRSHVKDTVEQINWIYTARNNPYFQTQENSNHDRRAHTIAGGLLAYGLADWLSATLRGGTDEYNEDRKLEVAEGWKGGYPTALGRGDFAGGGSQRQRLIVAGRMIDLALTAASRRVLGLDLDATAGMERRTNRFRSSTAITDIPAAGGAGATSADARSGDGGVSSAYVIGAFTKAQYLTVNASLRAERASDIPAAKGTALFPSLSVSYDAAQKLRVLRERLGLGTARLGASWWRAGNEITTRTLAGAYAGGGTATAPTLGVPGDAVSGPERTSGIEFSSELSSTSGRVGLDFTVYEERASEVLFGTGAASLMAQSGVISNHGYEAQVRVIPYRGDGGSSWEVAASFARNTNRVDQLVAGIDEVELAPPLWGASLVARRGSPLGSIVGTRYLRDDATGALLLKNGLPLPDGSAPLSVLGSLQPDWTTSIQSRVRVGPTEFFVLFDARIGGRIFSATNLWGSYAGTLQSTVAGRDSGMVIAGIDSATGTANAATVSPQDYFHSLAAIHEAWVYDASYAKLREARLTYSTALRFLPGFREHTLRASLVGRNLVTWAKAPNIDPETALSAGAFQGFEMGQLPNTRSLGLRLSIAP